MNIKLTQRGLRLVRIELTKEIRRMDEQIAGEKYVHQRRYRTEIRDAVVFVRELVEQTCNEMAIQSINERNAKRRERAAKKRGGAV